MTNTYEAIKTVAMETDITGVEGFDKYIEVAVNLMQFTVKQLEEVLDIECVDYKKRDVKQVKAENLAVHFVDVREGKKASTVQQTIQEEEVEPMEEAIVPKLMENVRSEAFGKKLPAPSTTEANEGLAPKLHTDVSQAFQELHEKNLAYAKQYMTDIDKFELVVDNINIYPSFKNATDEDIKANRIQKEEKFKDSGVTRRTLGTLTLQVPKGLLVIKTWDKDALNSKGRLGKPVYVPFENHDFDFARNKYSIFQALPKGTGRLTLPITENIKDGKSNGVKVGLPKERRVLPNGKTIFDEIFRTANIEFSTRGKDGMSYTDAVNGQLNAQVSAYLRMVTNTFIERNADNHVRFVQDACRHLVRFREEEEGEYVDTRLIGNTNVLNPIPGDEENQTGDHQPSVYCANTHEFVDIAGVKALNESYAYRSRNGDVDDRMALDRNGNERQPRADEVINGGLIVKRRDVISEAISQHCASCHMYCANTPEFKETPSPDAQLVETGFLDEKGVQRWVRRYPADIVDEGVELNGLRVRSKYLTVSGNLGLKFEKMKPVAKEPFDAVRRDINRKFSALRYGIHRTFALTEEQLIELLHMPAPEGMTPNDAFKWNNLVDEYHAVIQERLESEAKATEIPEFPRMFHAGSIEENMDILDNPETALEVDIQEVMSEILKKYDDGFLGFGLGFDGMTPEDIAKSMDDAALDIVFDVIADGVEVCVVSTGEVLTDADIADAMNSMDDTKLPSDDVLYALEVMDNTSGIIRGRELLQHAADGMQSLLQQELVEKPMFFSDGRYHDASYLAALEVEEDPVEKLVNMEVTDLVKGYLYTLINNQ